MAEGFDAARAAIRLAGWMRRRVRAAGARGLVFGISGGVDSAVVAALARRACPGNLLGLFLPCDSDPIDERMAGLVARSLDIPMRTVDLSPAYRALLAGAEVVAGDGDPPLARANLKARLRMATWYYYANRLDYLVAGGGNRSELEVGYFTKYGDGGVDLLPLAGLVKGQVYELAAHLGVPADVLRRPPTAGLWPGQTDEAELGLTYADLDTYLLTGRGPAGVAGRVEAMRHRSRHKRRAPARPRP
ncbi:MAG: NAD(+) synthase [bacterium]|nr:NAD(+) synthase [bacterium]